MSDRWMDAPRVRPFVCAVCRRGGQEHGPYWESSFHYPDPVTGAALRHYQCRQCLVNVFEGEGSPFGGLVAEARAARGVAEAAAAELREALDDADARIAELEGGAQPGPEELAARLAVALEERWGVPPDSWRARVGGRA